MHSERIVSVIGLGYVGLPVAVAFGTIRRTVGFDINAARIAELQRGHDRINQHIRSGRACVSHLGGMRVFRVLDDSHRICV